MMYPVYVVDDNPLILDEIVNTVPWLDNGSHRIAETEQQQAELNGIPPWENICGIQSDSGASHRNKNFI